jgi:hypothetical protein
MDSPWARSVTVAVTAGFLHRAIVMTQRLIKLGKQSPIEALKERLMENERQIRLIAMTEHHDAIRARLHEVAKVPAVSAFVPYDPQPDPKTGFYPRLPSYRQWKVWVESRRGLLTLHEHEDIRVLCVACGLPVKLSDTSPVVVGALVKWDEEEIRFDKYTMQVDEEEVTKISAVTVKAPGCSNCSSLYLKERCETARLNRLRMGKVREKGKRMGQPLPMLTAMLRVDPRDIDPIKTVAGFKQAEEDTAMAPEEAE